MDVKIIMISLLLLGSSLLYSGLAMASSSRPCASDFEKYCKDSLKERGGRRECISKNQDKFSDACKSKIEERKKRHGGRKDSKCREDFDKYCKDSLKGRGGRRECVRENQDKFSDACKSEIEERKKKHGGGKDNKCREDFEKYCKDASKERGGRRKCIRENQDKFSADCKSEIEERRSNRKGRRQQR
ncbi:MAG: hypothetical protein ISR65_12720 [Bacteriovoracaceae bacterium]|nr:hypothetical protein [Bacteriovoracaceae bacterium]